MGTMEMNASRAVSGYCGFCAVHCPVVTSVDAGARPLRVEPDRSHPDGGAICVKGRAAPEFHDHGDRVNFPMRRTRPKTSSDPGWQRCSWDEALDLIAAKLLEVRASSGAHAVAFNKGTTGGTALTDTERWLRRQPVEARAARDQWRPVDRRGNAQRSGSRSGADQRRHSARGGLLLARLVGGVPRAWPARLRSVQRGGRQSEPARAERRARSGQRRHAAPIDALPRSGSLTVLGRASQRSTGTASTAAGRFPAV